MNAAFYNAIRKLFDGSLSQEQVNGFEVIGEAWDKAGDGNLRNLAYILATAYHETARTMQPVRETLADTDAKAKARLTKAWKAGKLAWVKSDYWSGGFFGRGFVQLTHKANYLKAGQKLGLDLVADPSKAMVPEVAALILVRGCLEGWFTGKKLSDFPSDFMSARSVVNGSDRALLIAGYAYTFLNALEVSKEPAKPSPAPTPSVPSPKPPLGLWGLLVAIVKAVIGMLGRK